MLIDVILLLILVALVLSGYRKGLVLSLLGLVVTVLCCLGASAAQQALTPTVVEYLEPSLASSIQDSLEERLARETQDTLEEAGNASLDIGGYRMSLSDLAGLLGIDVEDTVLQGASDALAPAVEAAAHTAAQAILEQVAGVMIYFAAFLILHLVLHSVALALNVVDRLPVIHTLNRVGGAVFGLLGGLLAITVAAAVLLRAGFSLSELGPLTQLFLSLGSRLL